MIWPPANGARRLNLEVAADQRFEVVISRRGREVLSFRPNDRICLALKGAKIESRKESNAPCLLPFTLKYPDGVAIKYLSGTNAGKVINTWEELTPEEDWFDPGAFRRVSDVVMEDVSHIKVPSPSRDRDNTLAMLLTAPPVGNPVSHQVLKRQHNDHGANVRPGKGRKRKRKRQAREMLASGTSPSNQLDVVAVPQAHQETNNEPVVSTDIRSSILAPDGASSIGQCDSASVQPPGSTDSSPQAASGKSSLLLEPGFRTEMGDTFTALNAVRKGQAMVNIIGVVIQVNAPKRTTTNEWSSSFVIVDSSIYSSQGLSDVGIGVTCFQKKYVEWLPQVDRGDVVILRKLKISDFKGVLKAIGYSDKLRWAVYDHATYNTRPAKRGDAPEGEAIDNGAGYFFTPFWKPNEDGAELKYCRQLFIWREGLQEAERDVIRIQCAARPQKEHRLLSDVSPDVSTHGFFNCTVEILQTFSNDCGSQTVYVTDYTSNPRVYPVKPTWCSPALYDCVFPVEMWDEARDMAQLMHTGEYWYLYNVRARLNASGYTEGKMRTSEKTIQLSADDAAKNPRLTALLARRKQFLECNGTDFHSSNFFPYKFLQDVDNESVFFSCAVEILSIDYACSNDISIYATDYTFNPNLPERASTAEWAHGLDHRILRIKLDDVQAKMAREVHAGSFYKIMNLRFIQKGNDSGNHGRLGGEDRLIFPLINLESEYFPTLKANKEKWQRELVLDGISLTDAPTAELIVAQYEPTTRMSNTLPHTRDSTIHQVLTSPSCPSKFTVVARVVDFFPFFLEEASVLRCMKCKSPPPLAHKACPKCDDMIETHCKWCYCLYLRLGDDTGNDIDVSLCGEECSPFQGVEPDDFHYNRGAFNNFLAKLSPVIGNLRDVHEAWSENRDKEILTPLGRFTIESWKVGCERGYGLLSFTAT